MAAQTLDQILSGLQSVYQPQLDSVAQQQAALPAQYDAQAKGLEATQQQAFGSILDGARSRGTGVAFGGIPLQEQAQYTAGTYLPALANLKTAQTQQQQSLADSINKINEDKFNTANNMYQFGVTADQNQQQINNAAKAASSFNPTMGAASPTSGAAPTAKPQDPTQIKNLTGSRSQQDAYNAIQQLLGTKNNGLIRQTIQAINQSAQYGNTYDQAKLQLIQSMPEFRQILANGNGATF